MQGVCQWTNGLRYDNTPQFRFRPTGATTPGENINVTGPGLAANSQIRFDAAGKTLRWLNVAYARYTVYAFANATETNPANAVAFVDLPFHADAPLFPPDLSGNSEDRLIPVVFDINDLELTAGTYHLRVQVFPGINLPVAGTSPQQTWGAPSPISGPIAYTQ